MTENFTVRARDLVRTLAAGEGPDHAIAPGELDWLAHAEDDAVRALLEGLADEVRGGWSPADASLRAIFHELVRRSYSGGSRDWKRLGDNARAAAVALYDQLPQDSSARHLVLQLLAASGNAADLRLFADRLIHDPPQDTTAVAIALGPLFQRKDYDPGALFPQLLQALTHRAAAPAVMDLANFVTREGLAPQHPGAGQAGQLTTLLGDLTRLLERIEESPGEFSSKPQEVAAMVSDGVSLAVSLCDALALIGYQPAIGKLYQTLDLKHRRLRTEAAAALARLGEDAGVEALAALAREPVARLRVLSYASELQVEDRIPEQYSTNAARAEAELALWLAQPSQFGLPPSRLELVDTQTLFWPGFDEPVECFLFRFVYALSAGDYSNIGIAGPDCHAFEADLADLPPDDIYAMFAGRQVQHEDILEWSVSQLTELQRIEVIRLERRLRDGGFDAIQPLQLCSFFGERALVARAGRDGQTGLAVANAQEVQWHVTSGRPRPLGPLEVYSLYKGRKLLRTFNP